MLYIDGNSLSIEDVVKVVREDLKVSLSDEAIEKMEESRQLIESYIKEGRVVYGINTGFGSLCNVAISNEELEELQINLIYADAVGIGEPFSEEVTRAIMLLRLNALAKGYSGISQETFNVLLEMLNKRVHPVIRSKGSVGSSGDLCPLAHMVLPMMGEGEAYFNGERLPGHEALKRAGIKKAVLKAKEGLALINGTCAMMGVGVLAVYDAISLTKTADIVSALTLEALEGVIDPFDPRVHNARPHKGQIKTAQNIRNLCSESKLITRQGEKRVQDAYTLRCIPQIHGGSRAAIDYVREVVETEINAATDNPLIFAGENANVISGGNFHGQPIAIAMDTLGIAVSELANVSERRIERLLNPSLNDLPGFLVKKAGLNCGFMVAQYAAAALVSENKVLAHPASVDSIPTCANQEDHVSMGTIAARKAATIISHAQSVLAIEWICAAQGADFRGSEKLGKGSKIAYDLLRGSVDFMEKDKILYVDIDSASELIKSEKLVNSVTDEIELG